MFSHYVKIPVSCPSSNRNLCRTPYLRGTNEKYSNSFVAEASTYLCKTVQGLVVTPRNTTEPIAEFPKLERKLGTFTSRIGRIASKFFLFFFFFSKIENRKRRREGGTHFLEGGARKEIRPRNTHAEVERRMRDTTCTRRRDGDDHREQVTDED